MTACLFTVLTARGQRGTVSEMLSGPFNEFSPPTLSCFEISVRLVKLERFLFNAVK